MCESREHRNCVTMSSENEENAGMPDPSLGTRFAAQPRQQKYSHIYHYAFNLPSRRAPEMNRHRLLGDEAKVVGYDKRHHSIHSLVHSQFRPVTTARDLRVWGNSDIVRAKATVEPQQTLFLGHLLEAVEHTLVLQCSVWSLCLLLQPRLDEVEGK